jgi:hypothetical protein
MSDPLDNAILQSYSRAAGGEDMDLVVGEDGFTTYALPEPEVQPEPMSASMTRKERRGQEPTITPMEGLQQFGEAMGGALTGLLPGAVAGSVGTPGDLAGLFAGAYEAATAEEGERLNAFLQTLTDISGQYGSEAALSFGRSVAESLPVSDQVKEGIAGGLEAGSFVGIGGTVTKGGKAIAEGVRNYAAGAPARVAERGTGTTLQSGVDPMAAVDEAIVGLKGRAAKAPTDEEEGFIAFSGSPSDFNKFSLSKIGTGEGNQQFGYGLYFSDIEDIARFYRDALSDRQPISLDDLDVDAPGIIENINITRSDQPNMGFLRESDPDFDEYMQMIEDSSVSRTSSPMSKGAFTDYEMKDGSVIRVSEGPDDALQETDPRVAIQALGEPTGKIYKVKINAIKNELVDQTKPLGKQSKKVKDALQDIGDNLTLDDAVNLGFDPFELGEQQALKQAREMLLDPESDVLSFLSAMQSIRGSVNAGEKALSDRGVKGMRYLTGAARQRRPIKAEQNYVIFDDKIIDILEKYGIVGPVAVSSGVASQSSQEQGETQ